VYAVEHETTLMIKTGCFWGTLADFKARVAQEKERDSLYVKVGLVTLEALQSFIYP